MHASEACVTRLGLVLVFCGIDRESVCLVGGPHAADLDVELAIPAEYWAATTPKHWRRPDARAGTPPYYVSPIADVPPTEVV